MRKRSFRPSKAIQWLILPALVLAGLLTIPVPPPPKGYTYNYSVPVLMYHGVDTLSEKQAANRSARDLTTPPQSLEQQIRFLKDNGYTFMTAWQVARAVRRRKPLPIKAVVITLDDGYESSYRRAFPIFRKYHVPATLFVSTGMIDSPGHLSWEQMQAMRRAGIEIGSHTVNHVELPGLPEAMANFELSESRRVLDSQMKEIHSIAYPAGKCDSRSASLVREAGYLGAWGKSGGPVRPGARPFELPRLRVSGELSLNGFKVLVQEASRPRKVLFGRGPWIISMP